jgi:hypothetical protein
MTQLNRHCGIPPGSGGRIPPGSGGRIPADFRGAICPLSIHLVANCYFMLCSYDFIIIQIFLSALGLLNTMVFDQEIKISKIKFLACVNARGRLGIIKHYAEKNGDHHLRTGIIA